MRDKENCFDKIWEDNFHGEKKCDKKCKKKDDDKDCCCNEGMAEALQFIKDALQDQDLIQNNGLDIFGINEAAIAQGATIVRVIGEDIVKVTTNATPNTRFISTCAIYFVNVNLDLNLNQADDLAKFNSILNALREQFTACKFKDCCCKDGVARTLNKFLDTRVQLNMNNQSGAFADVDGEVIAVDRDVVWLDTSTGGNARLTVASICYIAAIAPSVDD